MGAASNIEWTDATWTPIRARRADGKLGVHCEKVSPACAHCYAERLNKRNLPAHGTGLDFTVLNRDKVDIIVDGNMILQPLRWKRGRRIFVCSQTDLFGIFVTEYQIAQVFAVMGLAHWQTFQVLTKRAARMHELLSSEYFWEKVESFMWAIIEDESDRLKGIKNEVKAKAPEANPKTPLPNVWLGVTAENHEWASRRIPALLATPAAKRFVSCEPLLGPIDLSHNLGGTKWMGGQRGCGGTTRGRHYHDDRCGKGLDWVIAGGESGPGARPMHPYWAQGLRDQCLATGVPFFFKQWGEWASGEMVPDQRRYPTQAYFDNAWRNCSDDWMTEQDHGPIMYRLGKINSGRHLDGREWNQVPE